MRRAIFWKGALLAFLTAVGIATPARAQNRQKAWEVTPELGWVMYGNPHLGDDFFDKTLVSGSSSTRIVQEVTSDVDDSLSYGFRFAYHYTKKQMVEFGFSGTATTGTFHVHKQTYDLTQPPGSQLTQDYKGSESVSMDLIVGHINYVYNFFLQRRGKVVAFATGGLGLVNSSIFGQTADANLLPTLDDLVGDENTLMFNYGGGIRFFGGEKTGFRIDARQVRYTSGVRGSQDHLEVGVALTIILGGA